MFRFTIRDVLWLTVVVGLAVAWALDHHHQMTLVRFFQRLDKSVQYHQWIGHERRAAEPNP